MSAYKAIVRETVVERMGSAVDGALEHLTVALDKCQCSSLFAVLVVACAVVCIALALASSRADVESTVTCSYACNSEGRACAKTNLTEEVLTGLSLFLD